MIAEIGIRINYCKHFNTTIFLTEFWKDDELIHRRSNNPIIGYELKPNRTLGLITTNAFGFRDNPYPRVKPANSYRILVLGDSVTFAIKSRQEDSMPKKLEKFLNDPALNPANVHFEVLNTGVGGYNAYQEVEFLFEYGLSLNPDMVIINYVLNDQRLHDGGMLWYFNRRKSFLLKLFLLNKYRKLSEKIFATANSKKVVKENDFYKEMHYDPAVQKKYSRELQRVKKACDERNIRLVMTIFPLFSDIKNHKYRKVHQIIRAIAEKNGFSVIDLWSTFKDYKLKEVYQEYLHPNAKGYEIAATATLRFLKENRLIPMKSE